MGSYDYVRFPYRRPPELDAGHAPTRPVAVIGAGPVGLAVAIDLAMRGIPVVVLDDSDVVSVGSRAICWSKRSLEILDRLGVGDRIVEKGVTWQVGRVFHGERELYAFDLLPERGHKMPAFVNLQQYYVEQYLVERAADFPDLIELRWKNEVVAHRADLDGVTLDVRTPDGLYTMRVDWVVAADGARSPTRTRMGLPFAGQAFEERFLIADVRAKQSFPNERLFWFRPPFHAGQSALLHKQPDDIYRLDFQLGPDADPEAERQTERVIPRVRAVFGRAAAFELEWCSVYAFRCARLERFVHGRVIFAGDSAHVVSPFGARGGNGGLQDADNLAWKLALVVGGEATCDLIDSYDDERGRAADENIQASSRTTTFMTPKSAAERRFRDAALDLAADHPFARALVNGGRLSQPCSLAGLSLAPARDPDTTCIEPGTVCPDAPLIGPDGHPVWLLNALGLGFACLWFEDEAHPAPDWFAGLRGCIARHVVSRRSRAGEVLIDPGGLAFARYAARGGDVVLIRPDQHVAATFYAPDEAEIAATLREIRGRSDASGRMAA